MKTIALVSSKSLAKILNSFNVDDTRVTQIEKDYIYFHLKDKTFQVRVVTGQIDFHSTDDNLRWDWIKKLVDFMDEQPILLTFTPTSVNLTTQY